MAPYPLRIYAAGSLVRAHIFKMLFVDKTRHLCVIIVHIATFQNNVFMVKS